MNTTRPTTSTASRTVPALLAAAVASIVLGIIGMHALSNHGVVGNMDHSNMTSSVSGQMVSSHAGGPGVSDTSSAAGAHGGMSNPASDGSDGHSLSMVALCFAMLAATAGALLLLLLGVCRRPRVRAHRPAVLIAATRRVTARLGTGPPYVWNFSVIRC